MVALDFCDRASLAQALSAFRNQQVEADDVLALRRVLHKHLDGTESQGIQELVKRGRKLLADEYLTKRAPRVVRKATMDPTTPDFPTPHHPRPTVRHGAMVSPEAKDRIRRL